MNSKKYSSVTYEILDCVIAKITLDRPNNANAQDTNMLYELNDAMQQASQDENVRVIILAANGNHFSAGHDLIEAMSNDVYSDMEKRRSVSTFCCYTASGIEGHMAREEELYYGLCERWRNIPKPIIAAVHGKCIAGGLMLIWPCDIIIASSDATFCDPTVSFGVPGVEYFTLPTEVGYRKAKELLFTSDTFSAEEAYQFGMINHVVPQHQLQSKAIEIAKKISTKSAFSLKLAKQAINDFEDAQGRKASLKQAFDKHQLAHAHNLREFDSLLDPCLLPAATRKLIKGK